MEQCLSDDLNTIEADIAALETGKADAIHTHTGYAAASDVASLQTLVGDTSVSAQINSAIASKADSNHTHAEYAAAGHSHSEYAVVDHTHTGYASESHEHAGYASSAHTHSYNDLNDKPTIPTSLPANGGNADTVDGKHASEFASASDIAALQALVGDTSVSSQIAAAVPSLSGYATESYVNTKVSGIVNSAPEALDTLNELAAALGDDPNFATTVATQIGSKASQDAFNNLAELVGNTAVSAQISTAVAGKANADHTHTEYAVSSHTHNNYASATHSHTGYASTDDMAELQDLVGDTAVSAQIASAVATKADVNHAHTNYAATNHTHANKADLVDGTVPASQIPSTVITLDKLSNIMSMHYELPVTVTVGENYSSATGATATLIGNMLRIKFSAVRNAVASGNIDNETIATFSIAHGGKILGGYAVTFGTSTTGHIANMVTSGVSCNATALTFRATLTATAGDTSGMNPFFVMPVIIDLSKY